jgi:hypothetical protein
VRSAGVHGAEATAGVRANVSVPIDGEKGRARIAERDMFKTVLLRKCVRELSMASKQHIQENGRGGGIGETWAPDPNYKGKALQLQFTVEDKGVFTTVWSATKTYRRVFREWPENVCAENPHKYGTEKDAAVPTADKPDF